MLSQSNIQIRSKLTDYTVEFSDQFSTILQLKDLENNLIVCDQKINDLYNIKSFFRKSKILLLEATEENKSFDALHHIIRKMNENGCTRSHTLIAIGGGIIQDITAFVASILYRGISWEFIPTTLLSMADSCIGGKTSINFSGTKNQLGNFYPPKAITICIDFLGTLSELELRSGIGEMLHFYLVSGEDDFNLFADSYKNALGREKAVLGRMIHRSLHIKKKFIEMDEFDHGERLLLNYGHSFGHAIESMTQYAIPHGIAVCHGMYMANVLSSQLGFLNKNLEVQYGSVFNEIIGEVFPNMSSAHSFIQAISKDKKNTKTHIRLILTRGAGEMFIYPMKPSGVFKTFIEKYITQHFIQSATVGD